MIFYHILHSSLIPLFRPASGLKRALIPGLALAMALSIAASDAQARPEMVGENAFAERFTTMDADSDGKVSREEFAKALPTMRETAFDAMDENADGFLTLEEWQKAMAGHSGMVSMPPSGMGEPAANSTGTSGAPKGPDLVMPTEKKN